MPSDRAARRRAPSARGPGAPSRRASDATVAALARIVGAEHARADHDARARHARGKSTRPARAARRRADQRARPRRQPGVPRRGPGGARVLRRAPRGRRPVRRRNLGGRRPRPEPRGFAGVVALDVRRLDALCRWTRSRGWRCSSPDCAAPRPKRCSARAATRWATSPSPSSTRRSAALPRRGRAARARRATAALTSGCWRCGWPRRRGRWSSAAPPSRPPARTCASWCSGPRARWA